MIQKHIIAAALVGFATSVALTGTAFADDVALTQNQVQGTITQIVGKDDIRVKTTRGDLQDVTLRRGTVINPTGMMLRPGIGVIVRGTTTANSIVATRIDTPFHREASPVAEVGAYPGGTFGPYGFGLGDAGVFNAKTQATFVPDAPSQTTAASSSNGSQSH